MSEVSPGRIVTYVLSESGGWSYWAPSSTEGDAPGTWHWPTRA